MANCSLVGSQACSEASPGQRKPRRETLDPIKSLQLKGQFTAMAARYRLSNTTTTFIVAETHSRWPFQVAERKN